MCPVCLDELTPSSDVTAAACGHTFVSTPRLQSTSAAISNKTDALRHPRPTRSARRALISGRARRHRAQSAASRLMRRWRSSRRRLSSAAAGETSASAPRHEHRRSSSLRSGSYSAQRKPAPLSWCSRRVRPAATTRCRRSASASRRNTAPARPRACARSNSSGASRATCRLRRLDGPTTSCPCAPSPTSAASRRRTNATVSLIASLASAARVLRNTCACQSAQRLVMRLPLAVCSRRRTSQHGALLPRLVLLELHAQVSNLVLARRRLQPHERGMYKYSGTLSGTVAHCHAVA